MTINGANFSINPTFLCNDGSIEKYFTGSAPSGWSNGALPSDPALANPVTFAEDATGSGTRYDVYDDADFASVPMGDFVAGDVLNIHYNVTPYNVKLAFRGQGTESNPIRIVGVTNIAGQRPQFDFNGATTAATCNTASHTVISATEEYGDMLGGIVIKTSSEDVNNNYGTVLPQWIQIENLELYGAADGNSYTTIDGNPDDYGSSAGIYFLRSEDCMVKNCVIYDNGFGIFSQAKDEIAWATNTRLTVRDCRIYDNGVSGSYLEHNLYVQGISPLIEGNYIGQVRAGSPGSSYKSRASGEIFRYNYVEGSARVCDWVHAEEQSNGVAAQSDYGTLYVYGNTFVNDHNLPQGGALNALHVGGDNLGEDENSYVDPTTEYLSQCYFWNNTIINRSVDGSTPYRFAFFDLSIAVGNPSTNQTAPTTVDAWNNIFLVDSSSTPSFRYSWVQYAGRVNLRGNNLVYGGTVEDATDQSTQPTFYEINSLGTIITGDPVTNDVANQDLTLGAGSAAFNQCTDPAAMSAVIAAHPVEYQPNGSTNGRIARATVTTLGAYQ